VPQEVSTLGTVQCPRCEEEFHTLYDEVRFRSGSFHDAEREEAYEQLCEECHREVTGK
jgi:hypothetical protein